MAQQQKLFILIRKDIPVADQGVQAGHAVAEWCESNCRLIEDENYRPWHNQTLVYVTVLNLSELMLWIRKIAQKSLTCMTFIEPDMNNEITAIACLTDSNIFDKLPLWDPVQQVLDSQKNHTEY